LDVTWEFQFCETASTKPGILAQKLSKWKRRFPLVMVFRPTIKGQWSDTPEESLWRREPGKMLSQSEQQKALSNLTSVGGQQINQNQQGKWRNSAAASPAGLLRQTHKRPIAVHARCHPWCLSRTSSDSALAPAALGGAAAVDALDLLLGSAVPGTPSV
jgi:hypothetical protein